MLETTLKRHGSRLLFLRSTQQHTKHGGQGQLDGMTLVRVHDLADRGHPGTSGNRRRSTCTSRTETFVGLHVSTKGLPSKSTDSRRTRASVCTWAALRNPTGAELVAVGELARQTAILQGRIAGAVIDMQSAIDTKVERTAEKSTPTTTISSTRRLTGLVRVWRADLLVHHVLRTAVDGSLSNGAPQHASTARGWRMEMLHLAPCRFPMFGLMLAK